MTAVNTGLIDPRDTSHPGDTRGAVQRRVAPLFFRRVPPVHDEKAYDPRGESQYFHTAALRLTVAPIEHFVSTLGRPFVPTSLRRYVASSLPLASFTTGIPYLAT